MIRLQRNRISNLVRLIVSAILEEVDEEICVIKRKKLWVRKWLDRRDKLGSFNCLLKELALEDPKEYFDILRMSESCVNFLLSKIKSKIQRKDTVLRSSIPAVTKLQAVLYFLVTGCSLRTLTQIFRLGKSTISEFIIEVCEAIYESLVEFIKIPTTEDWKIIENGFREEWNFPGCCGAIDGRHIVIRAPPESKSLYNNHKEKNSMILMAVVDHKYCFSYVDIGCNGSVFHNCSLYQNLENGILPEGLGLAGNNEFPLKNYLLKPYSGNQLTLTQENFNYRLSQAQRIVENTFGILAARFRVFKKSLPYSPEKVIMIVKTCCALHNWLRQTNLQNPQYEFTVDSEQFEEGTFVVGNWRSEPESLGMQPLPSYFFM